VPDHDEDEAAPASDGLVWHYTDGTGLLSIVGNGVLWATASGFLNDTDEVMFGHPRGPPDSLYRNVTYVCRVDLS
jgi:hypothetical protein